MLKFHVLTLFPELFTPFFETSIIKRAQDSGATQLQCINFRDYATDRHRTVDDYPFGGGAGMLLKPEPIFRALEALQERETPDAILLMTPQGKTYRQSMAQEFSQKKSLVILCGHYEGMDDRVRQTWVTDEISLGDFVMTGGEIAAMAVIDSVVRLLPSVLGNQESLAEESHSHGLLEYPQYTRPAVFRGISVPPVLLSGHHGKIAEWRRMQSLYRTWKRRPDMLLHANLSEADHVVIERFEKGDWSGLDG
ncbi:tRNA (guanosine(37)-N1)-methyltransferase TrmD [Alicyclobacillus sp. TC]|uniref:tRNA (guanosine(37)-N1)-methyltransferase TrmD n=1 Tax=Alicyclobacillus sp. TC TaxID=2606450 RepID=UPI00193337EE|nr:tRNA (guanosine(37)-N1)-methyltransferase TrmD [Alicyclobacillus sp. TC]QRF23747.1 tRNA (guanosine(37)-N1)-methyltransferase TrmD [Alicyclobacillus sp. TC]